MYKLAFKLIPLLSHGDAEVTADTAFILQHLVFIDEIAHDIIEFESYKILDMAKANLSSSSNSTSLLNLKLLGDCVFVSDKAGKVLCPGIVSDVYKFFLKS